MAIIDNFFFFANELFLNKKINAFCHSVDHRIGDTKNEFGFGVVFNKVIDFIELDAKASDLDLKIDSGNIKDISAI